MPLPTIHPTLFPVIIHSASSNLKVLPTAIRVTY